MYHPLTSIQNLEKKKTTYNHSRSNDCDKNGYIKGVKEREVSSKASSMPVIAAQKIPALAVQIVIK
jgi:hypothetical protein